MEGVEVEVVGAEAAEARLDGAGEELRGQRQRLGRLGAAAAEDAAQRRHRLDGDTGEGHQRRLEAARADAGGKADLAADLDRVPGAAL